MIMMMVLLKKRRVRRGVCVVLGLYTIFFLALVWTAGDTNLTDQPGHFNLFEIRHRKKTRDTGNEPRRMPARRQLSKPDSQLVNVVVEDPLPGTFLKQAPDPEMDPRFEDLQGDDFYMKNLAPHNSQVTNPRALDRIIAGSPADDFGQTQTDGQGDDKDDSGFNDFDPNKEEPEEKRNNNLGMWISPDGAVESQRETETDAPVSSEGDQQGTNHGQSQTNQLKTERPADLHAQTNSQQQETKLLKKDRPADPHSQTNSRQQEKKLLKKDGPTVPHSQTNSQQQETKLLKKDSPANSHTQTNSQQQETKLLKKYKPDPHTQTNSQQQETKLLRKDRPANSHTQTNSQQQETKLLRKDRPADPHTQTNSQQQETKLLRKDRPANSHTQTNSQQQETKLLRKDRPANSHTQTNSQQQETKLSRKDRPHPHTQTNSQQQETKLLKKHRPADPHSQRNSRQQETEELKKEPPADIHSQPTPRLSPRRSLASPSQPSPSPSPSSAKLPVSRRTANFVEIADVIIYSAFYDDRLRRGGGGVVPLVRMLGLGPVARRPPVAHLWCVFAAASAEPAPVSVRPTADCKRRRKYCFYMLHCQIPERVQKTNGSLSSVVIVAASATKDRPFTSQPGERVRLNVIHNTRTTRHDSDVRSASGSAAAASQPPTFSVCVPPLFGKITVLQLVEFVELNRLLGAGHFVFYTFRVSRDVARVLTFYEEAGVMTVMPWNIPAPNDVWNKGESVAMGDCLYRNMHVFDYVVFSNLNEYFVPKLGTPWQAFIKTVSSKSNTVKTAAYEISSVKVYPNATVDKVSPRAAMIKSEMAKFLTLRNTLRGKPLNGNATTKLVVKPERMLEVDSEFRAQPVAEMFVSHRVDSHIAAMYHFTSKACSGLTSDTGSVAESCDELYDDRSIWKFKDVLVERTKRVLRTLNQQVDARLI